MRLARAFVLLLLAHLGAGVPGVAQTPREDPEIAARIDRFVADSMGAVPFSGTIAVSRSGELVFSRGYGVAHREEDVPVTPRTRFLIGSLTKQLTAAAVLMLHDRGRLGVHDPVCRQRRRSRVRLHGPGAGDRPHAPSAGYHPRGSLENADLTPTLQSSLVGTDESHSHGRSGTG